MAGAAPDRESGDSGCRLVGLGEGGVLTALCVSISAGGMSPQASQSRRRWLNQSTYSKVAISACSAVRQAPQGLGQLGLEQPDHQLGEGVAIGITNGS